MTSDLASTLLEMYCQDIAQESATNRKVIAAVPTDKGGYTPIPSP